MLRKALVAFLLVIVLALPVTAQDDKSYSADRFNVDVVVQDGGSLQVTEHVEFRFVGGPFSYAFRELPTDHTDGIRNIRAGADGVAWPQGVGPGQVEIEDGNPIRVTWHLSPTSNTVQAFDLSYEALGVVRQTDSADVLDWQALPESYEYTIAGSEVTFNYPPAADLISPPVLPDSKGDVSTTNNQVIVTSGNLGPDEPLVVSMSFAPGSLITEPPAWQAQQNAINDLAWIWAALAGVILLGGSTALVLAARPYRRESKRGEGISYLPPSDLSPTLAGIISGNDTSIGWTQGLATVFDLANRGYVQIAELDSRKWYEGQGFVMTLLSQPTDPSSDEIALLDLLFTGKSGEQEISVTSDEMGKRVTSSRWNDYKDSLKDQLIHANLISPEREAAIKRFALIGVMLLLLDAALFAAALLLGSQLGYWTLLPIGAIFVVALVAFITAASISSRSAQGEQVAADWAPFRRYIEQASRGKQSIPNPELFERYLPYATAFGVAENWAKQNERAGWHEAPAYFRGLDMSGTASMASFVAIIAATNSSGGSASASAAGGAAAGAAGGGASGAG